MTTPKPASAPPVDALLPCPFCGNPNVTDDEGCFPLNHEHSRWEVRCGNPSCYAHEQQGATREEAAAKWNRRAASAQVREAEPCPYGKCDGSGYYAGRAEYGPCDCQLPKPAAEPVPVAQGDGSVLAFVRVMRNLRERYPADADVVEAYSNILQAAIIKQAETRTALEASLAACRANEARYLWLRNKAELVDDSDYWLPQVCAWDYKPGPQLNERFPSLDSAIDALRQEAPHAE